MEFAQLLVLIFFLVALTLSTIAIAIGTSENEIEIEHLVEDPTPTKSESYTNRIEEEVDDQENSYGFYSPDSEIFKKVDSMIGRLDKILNKLDSISAKMDKVSDGMEKLKVSFDNFASKVGSKSTGPVSGSASDSAPKVGMKGKVTFYSLANFRGSWLREPTTLDLPTNCEGPSCCKNLSLLMNDATSSIQTHGNCVQVYEHSNCNPWSKTQKLIGDVADLGEFSKMISSAKLC